MYAFLFWTRRGFICMLLVAGILDVSSYCKVLRRVVKELNETTELTLPEFYIVFSSSTTRNQVNTSTTFVRGNPYPLYVRTIHFLLEKS